MYVCGFAVSTDFGICLRVWLLLSLCLGGCSLRVIFWFFPRASRFLFHRVRTFLFTRAYFSIHGLRLEWIRGHTKHYWTNSIPPRSHILQPCASYNKFSRIASTSKPSLHVRRNLHLPFNLRPLRPMHTSKVTSFGSRSRLWPCPAQSSPPF